MQRAWLWFCPEHWCCHLLAEGVVNFFSWGWLLFVWCCCLHWCTRHGKDHASCINGIHERAWKFSIMSCVCKSYKTEFFLMSMMVILFDVIVVIAIDIIGTREIMPCWLLSSQITVTFHLTLSTLVTHHNIFPHLQVKIYNAGIEETALVIYWMTDGVDSCWVGFTSWHLVKHGDKFDGALAQVTTVYSAYDVIKQERHEVY